MGDVLDKAKARAFAWRVFKAGDPIDLEEPAAADAAAPAEAPGASDAPADDDAGESDALASMRAEARGDCAAIAAAVGRTWDFVDPRLQIDATARLARWADRVGIRLATMAR